MLDKPFDDILVWLYNFDQVAVRKAIFLLTKKSLLAAIALKLEITNNNYSDIFDIAVRAAGGKVERKKVSAAKSLPKAGFDQMAAFIGAM